MASRITIDDIAEALGVSKTTVSRAISGKGRISKDTTDRVRSYISEHNYKPNTYAKGLATQRTFNIGVIWPGDAAMKDLPFFQKCLLGINKAATQQGYDILLTILEEGDTSAIRRVTDNQKVDGIILTRTLVEDAPAQLLKETGIPFVAVGSSADPEVLCADSANETACLELVKSMLQKQKDKIALLGGDTGHVITGTRLQGFLRGCKEAGYPAEDSMIRLGMQTRSDVEEALVDVMSAGTAAVIGMDDGITREIIAVCQKREIEVPKDLRVASFYDSVFLENTIPAVPAIHFDDMALGETAAHLLFRKMAGEEPESVMLDNYEIRMRETF